nr:immunoglobulin heavy chain junction region [Macaca mulatta]
CTRCHSNYDFW